MILVGTVGGWWVTWDLDGRAAIISTIVSRWLDTSSAETLICWVRPAVSLGTFLLLCNTVDRSILRLKWRFTDALLQAWWKLVSFVIPLLLVAAGFDAILEKKLRGIAWLLAAGAGSEIGTGVLRWAEGMKLNALKSGELRKKSLSAAPRMGVTLSRVYVVPAGKGHLTNAYGMSNAIGLTDNLGKYLTKMQI